MKAYFDLLNRLIELYPTPDKWIAAAKTSGADVGNVVLQGSALSVWINILDALRVQKRLDGLSDRLSEDQAPDAAAFARQYAADVARGEGAVVNLPHLLAVDITEQDLQPGKAVRSLDFSRTLSLPLLWMSLTGQASLDGIDGALSGRNTIAAKSALERYRDQAAEALSALMQRRTSVQAAISKRDEKIKSIENASPPYEPPHRDVSSYPEGQRAFWYNQEDKERRAYQEALARYEADRNSLGSLRLEREPFARELATLESSIADQKARNLVGERPFLDGITQARDRDLLFELDRNLTQAATLAAKEPFVGFWTLLGTNCLLDLFGRVINQPSAASEASLKFGTDANAMMRALEDGLPAIAKGSLAGPAIIYRVLTENQSTLTELIGRLNALPIAQMQGRIGRATALLAEAQPVIPGFSKLEKESEIETARAGLVASRTSIVDHIKRVQALVDDEPTDLAAKIGTADADVTATIGKISDNAAGKGDLLAATSLLWILVRRGGASAHLPAFVKLLCMALPQDFSRRFDRTVDAVVDQAKDTEYGLTSTRTTVRQHLLTAYVKSRGDIQRRLTDSEKNSDDFGKAIEKIDGQYVCVANRYRGGLKVIAVSSIFPGINLLTSLWGIGFVNRMAPLLESNRAPYCSLGDFASKTLVIAITGAAAATAAGAATALTYYGDSLRDMDTGTLVAGLTASSLAGALTAFRNFLVAKAAVRARKSADGAAA